MTITLKHYKYQIDWFKTVHTLIELLPIIHYNVTHFNTLDNTHWHHRKIHMDSPLRSTIATLVNCELYSAMTEWLLKSVYHKYVVAAYMSNTSTQSETINRVWLLLDDRLIDLFLPALKQASLCMLCLPDYLFSSTVQDSTVWVHTYTHVYNTHTQCIQQIHIHTHTHTYIQLIVHNCVHVMYRYE